MGPIIWTCLALTVHQSLPQPYHMPARNFALPLKFSAQGNKNIDKFVLLFSADKGETWEQVGTKQAGDPKQFEFHARQDGIYWFLIQQVDHAGNSIPKDPYRAKPNQIIIVDTVRPQVKVTAERLSNGQIRAHWTASDLFPELHSLRMGYHTSAHREGDWTPLGIDAKPEGQLEFPVKEGVTGDIRVRVQMKDKAGNVGEDVVVVSTGGAASVPAEAAPFSVIPTTRSDSPSQPNQLTSQQSSRPVFDPAPGPTTLIAPQPASGRIGSAPAPSQFSGMPIAANMERPNQPGGNPPDASSHVPPVKIVKSRDVRLDFTVGKIGPSGLGNADIYVTLDKGVSWQKMPGEVPISLAQGAAPAGPEPVSGSVSVQLPKEAVVYGFIVAVKSKAGRGPEPPKPNDAPEVLVEWDNTAPKGQLFKPQPDPAQPNALVLGWEAHDRNLAEKPITLEWAEQKDGPWNLIGDGALPNSGQFPWRLPDRLPPRVYLRLTMRDQAGNEARAQTDKPELIDLSVPQTKITGVAPASR